MKINNPIDHLNKIKVTNIVYDPNTFDPILKVREIKLTEYQQSIINNKSEKIIIHSGARQIGTSLALRIKILKYIQSMDEDIDLLSNSNYSGGIPELIELNYKDKLEVVLRNDSNLKIKNKKGKIANFVTESKKLKGLRSNNILIIDEDHRTQQQCLFLQDPQLREQNILTIIANAPKIYNNLINENFTRITPKITE